MYSVPPARAWWPAVGAPLEQGVGWGAEAQFYFRRNCDNSHAGAFVLVGFLFTVTGIFCLEAAEAINSKVLVASPTSLLMFSSFDFS